MEYWTLALVQLIPLVLYILYYLNRKNQFWSSRGVKGPPPALLFGNMLEVNKIGQVPWEKENFRKYGKLYGFYQLTDPVLTVVDHELIKQVLVKDFHVFVNRDMRIFDHEIWNTNLFNAENEQWKKIRAITSPTFTTGKLRGMNKVMMKCVDKLGDYFDQVIKRDDGQMNIKEVITGFTIDVIATTSFATETNANDDRSKKNPFVKNGIELFNFSLWRFVVLAILPARFNHWIGNSIGLKDENFNFFIDLSREILRQRKLDNGKTKRSDLVQLMIDAFVYESELEDGNYEKLTANADDDHQPEVDKPKQQTNNNSAKKSLSENEIIAQCILFFIAGFETTASTLSHSMYHLAIYPEIQDRLYDEVTAALDGLDEDSNQYFETVINKIPYLEAVVKETLRLCPPVPRLQRRVGVDGYKLAGIPLKKDIEVDIGTLAVHLCADYYPDPELFNPDRFLPEHKHLLVPYTYLPFGAGPRNCIGMRFAYQEMKLCLAKIVQQFKFEPTAETKIPLEFDKIGLMTCKNIPLKVSKR